jgi:hypothetical protein
MDKRIRQGGLFMLVAADQSTLAVSGEDRITVFHAWIRDEGTGKISESPGERRFCSVCGSALWVWDPRWPNGAGVTDWNVRIITGSESGVPFISLARH